MWGKGGRPSKSVWYIWHWRLHNAKTRLPLEDRSRTGSEKNSMEDSFNNKLIKLLLGWHLSSNSYIWTRPIFAVLYSPYSYSLVEVKFYSLADCLMSFYSSLTYHLSSKTFFQFHIKIVIVSCSWLLLQIRLLSEAPSYFIHGLIYKYVVLIEFPLAELNFYL